MPMHPEAVKKKWVVSNGDDASAGVIDPVNVRFLLHAKTARLNVPFTNFDTMSLI